MSSPGEDVSQFGISKEEKDKLVAEVIRYMLFKTHQNSGCPIRRDELTQIVTSNYRQRSLSALIINEAKEKLSAIFGFDMRELQRSRLASANQSHACSQQSAADAKSYVLVSQLPPEVHEKYVEDANTAHMNGFAFSIISIVHLNGDNIPEEDLWRHLRQMGLSESDQNHPVVGNIKHALETLVQQRYLQKVKVNSTEGNTLAYELAERALDGTVKEKIKQHISQIVRKDVSTVEVES
ncbi:hypothetical protein K2173_026016 [Erythroxylum novogranatense]|uniref:MAGE domain-containing protein n=1 Tax=Erythroxylum novogranatense TaxID=1862640 RepID=A0AAV8SHU1_9ROSI|nr:hypothetical protein K2173_026016 [Erythroxylum novogranatense]